MPELIRWKFDFEIFFWGHEVLGEFITVSDQIVTMRRSLKYRLGVKVNVILSKYTINVEIMLKYSRKLDELWCSKLNTLSFFG